MRLQHHSSATHAHIASRVPANHNLSQALCQPRELLLNFASTADDVEKDLLQTQFLQLGATSVIGGHKLGLARLNSGTEVLDRTLSHQAPFVNNSDVTAQSLHNLQHM